MVHHLCLLLSTAEFLVFVGNIRTTGAARNLTLPGLGADASAYLHELDGYWPYNDSLHLARFEEFDHTHFHDSHDDEAASTEPYPAQRAGPPTEPVFDSDMLTNVTAQLGSSALLRCRVLNLAERPVSWVRRRDWHILTSGLLTYTNDERFQAEHVPGSDDWDLRVKYAQKRDDGTYECQVSTGSGTMSHYFHLHVAVPSAFILGSGEYHIGEGSTISLVCVIENSRSPARRVQWYHNGRPLDGMIGVSVSSEPGVKATHSRLMVDVATRAHSGNYTCRAAGAEPDTIHVFVSTGDNTAAIQRQESSLAASKDLLVLPTVLLACLRAWVSRS